MEDGERLAKHVGPMAQPPSERESERRGAQDDREDEEPERPAIQAEEQ
jgi:hypothetical protein